MPSLQVCEMCSEKYPERNSEHHQSVNKSKKIFNAKKKFEKVRVYASSTLVVRALRTPESRNARSTNPAHRDAQTTLFIALQSSTRFPDYNFSQLYSLFMNVPLMLNSFYLTSLEPLNNAKHDGLKKISFRSILPPKNRVK